MKAKRLVVVATLVAAGVALTAFRAAAPGGKAMDFKLTSPVFTSNHDIPVAHSCDGAGTSPALRWEGTPSGTRSLALIVHDPDAPGGDFVHWLVWDLPATVTEVPSGEYQEAEFPLGGLEGQNSFGNLGFGAPCPPPGPAHHYIFTVYALDAPTLGLAAGASRGALERAMRGKVIGKAELVGLYQRK